MAFSEAAGRHPQPLLGAQESDFAKKQKGLGGGERGGGTLGKKFPRLPGRELQRKVTQYS